MVCKVWDNEAKHGAVPYSRDETSGILFLKVVAVAEEESAFRTLCLGTRRAEAIVLIFQNLCLFLGFLKPSIKYTPDAYVRQRCKSYFAP